MKKKNKIGVLEFDYIKKRNQKGNQLEFRAKKRASVVIEFLKKHFNKKSKIKILDLGCAEGLMLNEISKVFKNAKLTGIEYNKDMVKYGKKKYKKIQLINKDIENHKLKKFNDVILLTAVIEHVENQKKLIKKIYKYLPNNGYLIITCPDPFWESFATKLGLFHDDNHTEVPNLKRLNNLILKNNFNLVQSSKFMAPSFGFFFDNFIESFFKFLNLDFFLINQLVIGKKIVKDNYK